MSSRTFDRDTILDLSVNMIPMGIILFFIVVFVAINPFGSDPVATALQLTIVVVMFLAMGILTYVSGKAIAESEQELEAMGIDPHEGAQDTASEETVEGASEERSAIEAEA
jgi:hypothetical protein